MKYLFLLVLMFFFSACGLLPLRIGIEEINATIPIAVNTSNSVIYQKNPSTFTPPTLSFSSVKLEGNASATPITNEVRMFLYARHTDPSTDASCTSSGTLYFCPNSGQKKINTTVIVLSSGGTKKSFAFDDANNALRDAINNGKIWLGIEVTSGAAVGLNLKLSELLSIVTLL